MARVLIIEDDARMRETLGLALRECGHEIRAVSTAEEALTVDGGVDLALLDLGLPDRNGLEILKELRTRANQAPIIVITGETDMATTIRAMRDGAFDYLTKPLDLDTLERMIERALKQADANEGQVAPKARVPALAKPEMGDQPPELLGESPAMREVFKTLGLLAASRATVLIRGESGTGKELAARALHRFSQSAQKPFVAVNCAALPGTLIESELFGYRRGAFTGAERDRPGKLEAAEDGTLFLDEVGDVPLEVQVKLLRVLQERRYERLGETESRPFKARVVAATHRALEAMVRENRFREDLYFRLNVATVMLPPLRERRADIPLLAERILAEIAREIGRSIEGLTSSALDRLVTYDFPGNVRELRNALTRAAVRARGHVINDADLELGSGEFRASVDPGSASVEAAQSEASRFPTLDEVEREHIRRALARTHGHRGKTCKLLGISRPTLVRKLRKYKIDAGPGGGVAQVK